jgi:hypothetical protein
MIDQIRIIFENVALTGWKCQVLTKVTEKLMLADRHQYRDLLPLTCFVAARDRVLDAVRDMIFQDFLFNAPECRAHRGNLRDDARRSSRSMNPVEVRFPK